MSEVCCIPGCAVRDVHTHGTGGVRVCEEVVMPLHNPESHTASGWMTRADELHRELEQVTRERNEARAELATIAAGLNPDFVPHHLAAHPADVESVREGARDLLADNDRLRALLREAEWAGVADCQIGHGWARRCPWCDACEHCGHTLDCRLKAALEG